MKSKRFVSISEARGQFNEVAREVAETGESVIVLKNSRPYVVIGPWEEPTVPDPRSVTLRAKAVAAALDADSAANKEDGRHERED